MINIFKKLKDLLRCPSCVEAPDFCVCPTCGYKEPRERGVSCYSKVCSTCGSHMGRK